jgi:hypothetical protein
MAAASTSGKAWSSRQPSAGPLAQIGGALAWAVMGLVGAVAAAVIAATLVAVAVVGSAALGVVALVLGARRAVRSGAEDPDIIEARHVGGHSWVASGWQGRP